MFRINNLDKTPKRRETQDYLLNIRFDIKDIRMYFIQMITGPPSEANN